MRNIKYPLLAVLMILISVSVYPQKKRSGTVFQTAPINALLQGVMNDNYRIGSLKHEGNFGLGTFNGVDGEMIMLNGVVYRVKNDGKAVVPPGSTETPFACVTFFRADTSIVLNDTLDLKSIENFIDKALPSTNLIYAVKISGMFKYVESRSEAKQTKEYSSLGDVLKDQSIFKFHNVEGTMAGFKFPGYLSGINVAGYHFHFLTEDKKAGGHVLNFTSEKVKIEIEFIHGFEMRLPDTETFYKKRFE